MANAAATLTENPHPFGRDNTQRRLILQGTCALSAGGTYVTNGIPLAAAAGWGQLQGVLTTQAAPILVIFFSQLAGGYQYVFDATHNTLRIFNGGTELANGAAITADTIGFKAEWLRGI